MCVLGWSLKKEIQVERGVASCIGIVTQISMHHRELLSLKAWINSHNLGGDDGPLKDKALFFLQVKHSSIFSVPKHGIYGSGNWV